RDALDQARGAGGVEPDEGWPTAVAGRLARAAAPSFVPVINATGVVLHTNLGRAPLAGPAIEAMCRAAEGYTTLEYDIGRGARGSRHRHCRDLLVELTGAEDAIVVNNAAGGVLIALAALARDGEARASRAGGARGRADGAGGGGDRRRPRHLQRRQAAGRAAGGYPRGPRRGDRGVPPGSARPRRALRQVHPRRARGDAGVVPGPGAGASRDPGAPDAHGRARRHK